MVVTSLVPMTSRRPLRESSVRASSASSEARLAVVASKEVTSSTTTRGFSAAPVINSNTSEAITGCSA